MGSGGLVLIAFVVAVLPMSVIAGETTLSISGDRALDPVMPAEAVVSIVDGLNEVRLAAGLEPLQHDKTLSRTIQSGYLTADRMIAMLGYDSPVRADIKTYLIDINHVSYAYSALSVREIVEGLLGTMDFRMALEDVRYNVIILSVVTDAAGHAFVLASIVNRLADIKEIGIVADEGLPVSVRVAGRAERAKNMRMFLYRGELQPERTPGSEIGRAEIPVAADGSFEGTLSLLQYGLGTYTVLMEVRSQDSVEYVPADSFEIDVAQSD